VAAREWLAAERTDGQPTEESKERREATATGKNTDSSQESSAQAEGRAAERRERRLNAA
jgi:hypothetical protein